MKKLIITLCMALVMLCMALTASAAYLGDVSNDGKVTAADARAILRHSANLEYVNDSYKHLADVNGDKKVSAADARLALRMSAKLEELKDACKHKYTSKEIQKLTCEKDGIIEYRCSMCDHTYQDVTNAIGHEYISTVIKQVTCIESGEEIFKCKNCKYSYSEYVDALGHRFINSTCYSVGYCSRCKIKDEETIPTGHEIDPKTFKCSVCNSFLKSPVSFIPDTVESEIVKLRYFGDIGDPDTFKITEAFYCVGPFKGEPDIAYFVRIHYSYRSPRNVYKTGLKDIYIYEYSNVLHSKTYGYNSNANIQWINKTRYYINVDEIEL